MKGVMVPATIRRIFHAFSEVAGGEISHGGAPPTKSERLVFADHRKLARMVG